MQKFEIERNTLEQRARDLRTQQTQAEQAITRHKRETGQLRVQSQKVQSEYEELQDAMEQDQVEEGKLEALQGQMEEAKAEVKTHESSYQDSVIARDKAAESTKGTLDQMNKMDEQIAEAQAIVDRAEKKVDKLAEKREIALREKNAGHDQLQKMQRQQVVDQQNKDEEVERTADYVRQATGICERMSIDAGETHDSIKAKFDKLAKDLQMAEKR